MFDAATVQKIADLPKQPFELKGFLCRPDDWTVEDPAELIKPGPSAKTLGVSTLSAVQDYIEANRDTLDLATLVAHVVSPTCVQVLGPLDTRSRTRETFIEAKAVDLTDGFLGKFMPLSDFIVGVQVRFADLDDRTQVLRLFASVKDETVKTALDDGMTQVVQAKAGVALVSDVAVPNPVKLCGWRTFRDVSQVVSPYVLRVQGGARPGDLPTVALFEADGGAWKLTAIDRIREWLVTALNRSNVSVLA